MRAGIRKPWPERGSISAPPRLRSVPAPPHALAGRSRSAALLCDPRRMRAPGRHGRGHRGSLATGGDRSSSPGPGEGADPAGVAAPGSLPPRLGGLVPPPSSPSPWRARGGCVSAPLLCWERPELGAWLGRLGRRARPAPPASGAEPGLRADGRSCVSPFLERAALEKDTEGPNDSEKLNAYKKGLILNGIGNAFCAMKLLMWVGHAG